MIKKEFRDIIRQTLVILAVLIIIPLIYLVDRIKWKSETDYFGVLVVATGLLIILISNRLGIDSFKFEHENNSFEYLLTLPVSKIGIIQKKLIPRLSIVIALLIIYEILLILSGKIQLGRFLVSDFFIFKPVNFPVFVFLLMFYSFFVSLFGKKNYIGLLTIASLIIFVLFGFAMKNLLETIDSHFVQSNLTGLGFMISLLVIDIIIGFTFYKVFQKFDIKSLKKHGEKFAVMTIIPLILLSLISFLILLKAGRKFEGEEFSRNQLQVTVIESERKKV